MSLSCEEMSKMGSLCAQYEVLFSQKPNDMGFCNPVYQKIKKKNSVPFRRIYGTMSFEKRKAIKTFFENLSEKT